MSSRAELAAAAIAALGDSPDVELARRVLSEFDVRDMVAALVSTAGGGSGGSSPFRVVGPFSLDFTQFANEDDTVTLFTPAAGEWLIKAWGDIATAIPFNDSGNIDFSIAEDPPGPAFNTEAFWQILGSSIGNAAGNEGPPDTDNANGLGSYLGGTETFSATRRFAGNPVKMRAQSVVGDGTTGEVDLYFMLWTP